MLMCLAKAFDRPRTRKLRGGEAAAGFEDWGFEIVHLQELGERTPANL
jgi:hypothetical protein